MSRIGRMPVSVPSGVDVKIDGTTVTVKGPKGTLTKTFVKGMGIAFENNEIIVTRPNEEKESKYQEALIDIMTTEINKLLLEKGKILFGINVGDPSALFFITDISNYNVLITRSSNFYSLYNIEYYSQFYGNIFRLNEDISEELKKDDYIEKKDSTYSTLFNETKVEYKDTEITDSKLTMIL